MADSLIVGNFIGSDALAAVTSSGSLIILLVGLFNGISVGAGVIIVRYFGARDIKNLERAVHTTVAFGIAAGIMLMVIGIPLTPVILTWVGTPADVLPSSILYFRIYFLGSLAFVLYNAFVGILQAVGDSRHPLMYLIISSVINVVLDLFFIAVFHMGVGSAAFATVISQVVSAILCFRRLVKTREEYRINVHLIRFNGDMLACWCIIHVSYITIIVKFIPQIQVIFWAYPITWTLSSIIFTIYFFKSDWMHTYVPKKQN